MTLEEKIKNEEFFNKNFPDESKKIEKEVEEKLQKLFNDLKKERGLNPLSFVIIPPQSLQRASFAFEKSFFASLM